jgi:hypothetical protein
VRAAVCLWLGAIPVMTGAADTGLLDAPVAQGPLIDGDGRPIPCRCRSGGKFYELGDLVCMDTPVGPVLTRCAVVLNNTSWTPTRERCTLSEELRPVRNAATAAAGD